ncbi:hypothetical protein MGLY_03290 [Neomoorella glycerini]|uniref:Uncharacterized protein n=1 Tax=Neomoorella glycerini TaxID=55779 RepID=A0A6I5ZN20_9FIRM|nr:hypothetical protein [Moorella glycerini]QGP91005.1 hypothetical protein MGLY_03290 [Moorella glycerini]
MSVSKELIDTLVRLEPAKEPNESLRKLLRQKVISDIRKYELISNNFQKKYSVDFSTFRQSLCEPDFETEQDYFDWELAETRLEELREELKRLGKNG